MGKETKEPKTPNQAKALTSLISPYQTTIIGILENISVRWSVRSGSSSQTYTLLYTPIGFFLASKANLVRKYKISVFISLFDVKSIEHISDTSILIKYGKKDEQMQFESANYMPFVKSLVESHASIFNRSPFFTPIEINKFPNASAITRPVGAIPPASNAISQRYISICAKYQQVVDPETLLLFEKYEKSDRISITFTAKCQAPSYYHAITLPMLHEQNLRAITFESYSPSNVCKIIYSVLKHNKNILAITMKNYVDFNFVQFNFVNLKTPSVVSWTFSNIFLSDTNMTLFFSEFKTYQGDVLSLTLDLMHFSNTTGERISYLIYSTHCFRTLEILNLTNIDGTGQDMLKLLNHFLLTASKLNSLQKLATVNWTPPPVFKFDSRKPIQFVKTSSIRHLTISFADLRSITGSIRMPLSFNGLEFNRCKFNFASLSNILKSILDVKQPCSFSIANMDIEQQELNNFYSQSSKIAPLENLTELDFSGNAIPSSFVKEFNRIFITSNLKYLSLNNVFGPDQIADVGQILAACEQCHLWGLELQGGLIKTTMGPKIKDIFPFILTLTQLEHLNLSFQRFTAGIETEIKQFLESMKNLHYLSIDGTGINKLPALYSFYEHIFFNTRTRALARPFYDLDELIPESIYQAETKTDKFQAFKQRMLTQMIPSTKYIRTFYYIRYPDMIRFQTFLSLFPMSASDIPANDKYGINCVMPTMIPIRSLADYDLTEVPTENIGCYQASLLQSPLDDVPPIQWELAPFDFPSKLMRYRGRYEYQGNLTRPEIKKKVKPREIVHQYQSMISAKNKSLFRNLAIVEDIFESVCMGNQKDEFSKNLTKYDPPEIVPYEAFQIIAEQVEGLEEPVESTADDNITLGGPLYRKDSMIYNSNSSLIPPSSSAASDSLMLPQVPLNSSASEDEANFVASKLLIDSSFHEDDEFAPSSLTMQLAPETADILMPRLDSFPAKYISIMKIGDFFDIGFIDESDDVEEFDDEQLELIEDMMNDKKLQEALHTLRSMKNKIYSAAPPKIRIRIEQIPDDPPKLDNKLPNLFEWLNSHSQRLCSTITVAPKQNPRQRSVSAANSTSIKNFISTDINVISDSDSEEINIHTNLPQILMKGKDINNISNLGNLGNLNNLSNKNFAVSKAIAPILTPAVTIGTGKLSPRSASRQSSENSSGPIKLPPRLRTAPLVSNPPLPSNFNSSQNIRPSAFMSNGSSPGSFLSGVVNLGNIGAGGNIGSGVGGNLNLGPGGNGNIGSGINLSGGGSGIGSGIGGVPSSFMSNGTSGFMSSDNDSSEDELMPAASDAFAVGAPDVQLPSIGPPKSSVFSSLLLGNNVNNSNFNNYYSTSNISQPQQQRNVSTFNVNSTNGSSESGEMSDDDDEMLPPPQQQQHSNTVNNNKGRNAAAKESSESGEPSDAEYSAESGEASDTEDNNVAPVKNQNQNQQKKEQKMVSSESGEPSEAEYSGEASDVAYSGESGEASDDMGESNIDEEDKKPKMTEFQKLQQQKLKEFQLQILKETGKAPEPLPIQTAQMNQPQQKQPQMTQNQITPNQMKQPQMNQFQVMKPQMSQTTAKTNKASTVMTALPQKRAAPQPAQQFSDYSGSGEASDDMEIPAAAAVAKATASTTAANAKKNGGTASSKMVMKTDSASSAASDNMSLPHNISFTRPSPEKAAELANAFLAANFPEQAAQQQQQQQKLQMPKTQPPPKAQQQHLKPSQFMMPQQQQQQQQLQKQNNVQTQNQSSESGERSEYSGERSEYSGEMSDDGGNDPTKKKDPANREDFVRPIQMFPSYDSDANKTYDFPKEVPSMKPM